ncbi:MAG: hypothetical protein IPJ81_03910 [Chitinophagaceae bacterium]|nr:hypothetical protein [Chitinophagaceae bacterium]
MENEIKDKWQATVTDDNEPYVYSEVTGDTIAIINTSERSSSKIDSDMKLIAAAPELLELIHWISKVTNSPEIGIRCDKLIKKATA